MFYSDVALDQEMITARLRDADEVGIWIRERKEVQVVVDDDGNELEEPFYEEINFDVWIPYDYIESMLIKSDDYETDKKICFNDE